MKPSANNIVTKDFLEWLKLPEKGRPSFVDYQRRKATIGTPGSRSPGTILQAKRSANWQGQKRGGFGFQPTPLKQQVQRVKPFDYAEFMKSRGLLREIAGQPKAPSVRPFDFSTGSKGRLRFPVAERAQPKVQPFNLSEYLAKQRSQRIKAGDPQPTLKRPMPATQPRPQYALNVPTGSGFERLKQEYEHAGKQERIAAERSYSGFKKWVTKVLEAIVTDIAIWIGKAGFRVLWSMVTGTAPSW